MKIIEQQEGHSSDVETDMGADMNNCTSNTSVTSLLFYIFYFYIFPPLFNIILLENI